MGVIIYKTLILVKDNEISNYKDFLNLLIKKKVSNFAVRFLERFAMKGLGTVLMLVLSNIFMTFAWYWHLKLQKPGESSWPRIAIILTSWLIALVEYIILIPANRIGSAAGLNVAQLKIIQEVVTVCVFVPFMLLFMGERWRWDYLWAFLCMVGAVYFVNRARL